MDILIKQIKLTDAQQKLLASSVSFSVDCDALIHYLNFAPAGTKISADRFTYKVMCRGILSILNKYNIKATFFCIADQLADPEVLSIFKEIVDSGHEIGNHTFSHPEIAFLSEEEHLSNIRLAHDQIRALLNVIPVGYRAPAYFITEKGLRELASLGYLYDSSLCHSKVTNLLMHSLKLINSDFTPKRLCQIHSRFRGAPPFVIEFDNHQKIIEWPIPQLGGLAYYGTLHCCAPEILFFAQTFMLRFLRKHIHYELHPLELINQECRKEFPWTNKLPLRRRKNTGAWLECRLKKIISNRKVFTLKELSNAYIHL